MSPAAAPDRWPASATVIRPVADLKPNPRNSRRHSAQQIEQLAAGMLEFGVTTPILADENGVILYGHARREAALLLVGRGHAEFAQFPVVTARGWSEAQKRAYLIADNQIAIASTWDEDRLRIELADLKLEGFNLDLMGFGATDLSSLLAAPQSAEERASRTIKPPGKARAKAGQVWALGSHRVACGDAGDAKLTARLAEGLPEPALLFTSPPYPGQRKYTSADSREWRDLMAAVFAAAPVGDATQILVNLGMVYEDGEWFPYWDEWLADMRIAGWKRFGWYVWDQGSGLPGHWGGRLGPSHEFIFHLNRTPPERRKTVKKKAESIGVHAKSSAGLRGENGKVGRRASPMASLSTTKIADSVIRITRQAAATGVGSQRGHPAAFPIALPRFVMASFSDRDAVVYEPFLGSGTTLLAAELDGRVCLGVDIAPQYVEIAISRWEDLTGRTAERLS